MPYIDEEQYPLPAMLDRAVMLKIMHEKGVHLEPIKLNYEADTWYYACDEFVNYILTYIEPYDIEVLSFDEDDFDNYFEEISPIIFLRFHFLSELEEYRYLMIPQQSQEFDRIIDEFNYVGSDSPIYSRYAFIQGLESLWLKDSSSEELATKYGPFDWTILDAFYNIYSYALRDFVNLFDDLIQLYYQVTGQYPYRGECFDA